MKRKWFLGAAATFTACSPISLVSCTNKEQNYDKLMQEIKARSIKDFIDITHHPRPTGQTEEIRNYLTNRVTSAGYLAQRDNYGNLWFDVPATRGRENWKKLLIQGHMDMVVAGLTEKEQSVVPIESEITQTNNGEWIMHSKDYKTSLGSDNGIGLGIMLAIMNNKHLEHGPLRFIITCDEETGMNGAAHLNPYILDSDYLINIDNETVNECAKSSCGSVQGVYEDKVDADAMIPIPQNWKLYRMAIKGLRGGHSGVDIEHRANADRCLCEILNTLNGKKEYLEEDDDGFVCLYEFGHADPADPSKEIAWGPTQLITNANVTFATSKNVTDIESAINLCVADWSNIYTDENWDGSKGVDRVEITFDPIDDVKDKRVILKSTTSKILTLTGSVFTSTDNPPGLPYGFIGTEYNKGDEPLTYASANIGPLKINGRDFALKSYSRSVYNETIDWFEGNNQNQWERRFTISGFSTPTKYYGWPGTENNQMIKLIEDSSIFFDVPCVEINQRGGLELSWFVNKRPTMQVSSIGPTIEMAHNVMETLHLDTLDITIKKLLYIIDHINNTI